jgi:hypothetical protein
MVQQIISETEVREERGSVISESPYIRREMEQHPEPEYINDLRILRRFIQSGSFGYRASTDVVFQTLKTRYPEAYSAFGEERKRETLERYRYSPYIEQIEGLPDAAYREKWLKDLKELRKIMILLRLGYGGFAMGMIFGKLKNRHPEAHETFKMELVDL